MGKLQLYVLLVLLGISHGWVWDQGAVALEAETQTAAKSQGTTREVMWRCQQEITKACSAAVKAEGKLSELAQRKADKQMWVDLFVHKINTCIEAQAEKLSVQCKLPADSKTRNERAGLGKGDPLSHMSSPKSESSFSRSDGAEEPWHEGIDWHGFNPATWKDHVEGAIAAATKRALLQVFQQYDTFHEYECMSFRLKSESKRPTSVLQTKSLQSMRP